MTQFDSGWLFLLWSELGLGPRFLCVLRSAWYCFSRSTISALETVIIVCIAAVKRWNFFDFGVGFMALCASPKLIASIAIVDRGAYPHDQAHCSTRDRAYITRRKAHQDQKAN